MAFKENSENRFTEGRIYQGSDESEIAIVTYSNDKKSISAKVILGNGKHFIIESCKNGAIVWKELDHTKQSLRGDTPTYNGPKHVRSAAETKKYEAEMAKGREDKTTTRL